MIWVGLAIVLTAALAAAFLPGSPFRGRSAIRPISVGKVGSNRFGVSAPSWHRTPRQTVHRDLEDQPVS